MTRTTNKLAALAFAVITSATLLLGAVGPATAIGQQPASVTRALA